MARLIGRERTLHATRRAPAHTHNKIRYTTTRDTIQRDALNLLGGQVVDASARLGQPAQEIRLALRPLPYTIAIRRPGKGEAANSARSAHSSSRSKTSTGLAAIRHLQLA